jgi:hypothetical protein
MGWRQRTGIAGDLWKRPSPLANVLIAVGMPQALRPLRRMRRCPSRLSQIPQDHERILGGESPDFAARVDRMRDLSLRIDDERCGLDVRHALVNPRVAADGVRSRSRVEAG